MIRRLRKASGPHTVLLNDTVNLIRDPVALAIFAYLHTKPDAWEISPREICEHFGIGRDRWRKASRLLRALGLLTLQSLAGGDKGAVGSHYVLQYQPKSRGTDSQAPEAQAPETRSPDSPPPEISTAGKSVPLETKELQQTKYLQETKDGEVGAGAPPAPRKTGIEPYPIAAPVEPVELPPRLNLDAWRLFDQHRRSTVKLRANWTDVAKRRAIAQLITLDHDQQQDLVDYSITGGYPGLYLDRVKPRQSRSSHRPKGAITRALEAFDAAEQLAEARHQDRTDPDDGPPPRLCADG